MFAVWEDLLRCLVIEKDDSVSDFIIDLRREKRSFDSWLKPTKYVKTM